MCTRRASPRPAEDPRTNELDIQIEQQGDKILLRGEVQAKERRSAVEQIAREVFPKASIENQIRLSDYGDDGSPRKLPRGR